MTLAPRALSIRAARKGLDLRVALGHLEGFTRDERALFLQFVWGRSRMPQGAGKLSQRFIVSDLGRQDGDPDTRLPTASTCFFDLHLPRYTHAEALAGHEATLADREATIASRDATIEEERARCASALLEAQRACESEAVARTKLETSDRVIQAIEDERNALQEGLANERRAREIQEDEREELEHKYAADLQEAQIAMARTLEGQREEARVALSEVRAEHEHRVAALLGELDEERDSHRAAVDAAASAAAGATTATATASRTRRRTRSSTPRAPTTTTTATTPSNARSPSRTRARRGVGRGRAGLAFLERLSLL